MAGEETFGDEPELRADSGVQLILNLEGYDGPLDVLLGMAREQKVDLVHISILALADQYLEFIARARQVNLELAADYLVMAAWLAYLKSRLLLPSLDGEEEPTGAELAAALAFQLRRYDSMKRAGERLMERPRLMKDFFPRGAPEGIRNIRKTVYEVSLYEVLKAYGEQSRRAGDGTLHISPSAFYSIDEALTRLNRLLGTSQDWLTLASFLPEGIEGKTILRSALATTFAASLELAKQGQVLLRQHAAFAPIYLRRANGEGGGEGEGGGGEGNAPALEAGKARAGEAGGGSPDGQ